MKTIMINMKQTLLEINGRLDTIEERIVNLKTQKQTTCI